MELFTTFIAQPIFNLLVLIYALLPRHNFGLAIIVFTVIVRLLLWPLLKKQLHQTKMMRKLQPEIKRIKQQTKGDKQKEAAMTMALYKERGVSPFGSIGIVIVQLPILIALYSGLSRVVSNPHEIVSFAYPALQQLPWMQHLAQDPHAFDGTLFGVINLTDSALSAKGVYWPALLLVVASAVIQYLQSKQLLVTDKNARGLRAIFRDAGKGKQADQAEVSAAIGSTTPYFIPVMVLMFTIRLASALSLYWLVGGLVAYIQQSIILREDVDEMESMVDKKASKDVSTIPEAEVVSAAHPKDKKSSPRSKAHRTKAKRRRR